MSNKVMKLTSGIIAGTMAATAVGLAVSTMRKPKSKLQRTTARTLNTISYVTQSLADMIG